MTSPDELKEKIGSRRTWWFDTGLGIAHANLFDDYVQIWDEGDKCLGNYDWFYLAASIQKMWNEIAMEKAEAAQSKNSGRDSRKCVRFGHVKALPTGSRKRG